MTRKQVRFSTIEIWEFAPTMGDNPSVSSGPPLTMNMKPWRRRKCPLVAYEKQIRGEEDNRQTIPSKSSKREKIRLSAETREDILRRKGFTKDQIDACSLWAFQLKQTRKLNRWDLFFGVGSMVYSVQ